jgi:hypothetical protein
MKPLAWATGIALTGLVATGLLVWLAASWYERGRRAMYAEQRLGLEQWDQWELGWTEARNQARFVRPDEAITPSSWLEMPEGWRQGFLEGVRAKERAVTGLKCRRPGRTRG